MKVCSYHFPFGPDVGDELARDLPLLNYLILRVPNGAHDNKSRGTELVEPRCVIRVKIVE